jgi:hypothetical protein
MAGSRIGKKEPRLEKKGPETHVGGLTNSDSRVLLTQPAGKNAAAAYIMLGMVV